MQTFSSFSTASRNNFAEGSYKTELLNCKRVCNQSEKENIHEALSPTKHESCLVYTSLLSPCLCK